MTSVVIATDGVDSAGYRCLLGSKCQLRANEKSPAQPKLCVERKALAAMLSVRRLCDEDACQLTVLRAPLRAIIVMQFAFSFTLTLGSKSATPRDWKGWCRW